MKSELQNKTHILLIGNGINRARKTDEDSIIEWNTMLNAIQDKLFIPENKKIDAQKTRISPTLLFESLCRNEETEKTVRNEIKTYIHKKEIDLSSYGLWDIYDTILTTNFDNNLINCAPKGKDVTTVYKNQYLYRRVDLASKKKKIFFIHGHYRYPETICLGFDHYIKNLTKIQSFVTSNYPDPKLKKFITREEGHRKSISWVDYFFNDNTEIDIIGLNLCPDEIDLWWLLKHRSKFLGMLKNNTIHYYDLKEFYDNEKSEKNNNIRDKKIILEAMGVKVESIECTGKHKIYDEAYYLSCLEKIKENFGK